MSLKNIETWSSWYFLSLEDGPYPPSLTDPTLCSLPTDPLTIDPRHEVSYSTAKAANQGITQLFRRYGYFEVEATIHMFEYIEHKPDGYLILINEESPPPPIVLELERDEPLLPLRDE